MNNNGSPFYIGVVEDRNDHLTLGRCKVRVVGLHTQDKSVLPTKDLPWAALMMPANSAGTSGVGVAPIGPVEGSTVMVTFNDPPYNQQPIVIGAIQGIPQQQSIINDTLDITSLYRDDIGSAGRDIPINYEQATALQSTPFDPGSFVGTDPYNLMLAIKEQSIGFAAAQLSVSFPGIDLTIGANLAQGLYGEVQFFPGDISVFSGAVDAIYQLTGAIGNVYGAVNQAFNDVTVAFNAITQGVTSIINGIEVIIQPPIVSIELLPDLFNLEIQTPVILAARANLELQIKNSTGGMLNGVRDVSQWEMCTLSPFDWEGFIRLGIEPLDSIEKIEEWAKKCLPTRCLEQLPQVIIDCTIRNVLSPENVVPCILTWIVRCLSAGGGSSGSGEGSTLLYTVEVDTLFDTINLEEIWSKVEGVALDAEGKLIGLYEGLTGFPQGITTAAMVVADTVDSAINGVVKTAKAFAEVPIRELAKYAKTGQAVMSVSYPAWTLIGGHCKPPENLPPPPSGLFAEAGRAAITALVSPLPHVNFNITLSAPASLSTTNSKTFSTTSSSGGSDIPTDPPPQFANSSPELRKQGIEALLKAAEKIGGLETKEQKCSLLAVAGGECEWIPIEEPHIWSSPDHLMNTFFPAFRGDRGLAEKYANWQGDKREFFEFVYSYKNDTGKDLGNKKEGDGGKFFGRGFIQIVGRSKYEKYAVVSGYDIVKNPELLVEDITVAAEVAVYYFKDSVQQTVPPASHPAYLEACISTIGYFSDKDTVRSYYDYFYGLPSVENLGVALKEAGPESPSSYSGRMGHEIENGRLPKSSQNLYLGRETGFIDPHNKYPLKPNLHRPDTNPLARGAIKESIVPLKEARRTRGIRLPFGKGVVDQPQPAYAAVYPYNHVMETESGHIQEFDDTPGAERIHTYHRSGTFTEIDSGGNQVNKIVGDKYTIIDKNGVISVEGEATISAVGNINIYCKSNVNIQSEGSVHVESGGNLDIKVAKDLQISAGGKIKMWSTGGNSFHTDKVTHIFSKDEFYNFAVNRLANISAGEMFQQGLGDIHLYGTNNINIDADKIYLNSGGATGNAQFETKMRFPPEPLSTASMGNPVKHRSTGVDAVAPTQRTSQGQRYHYETPEDFNTPGGQTVVQSEQKQQGQYNQFKGESHKELTGGVDKPPVSFDSIDSFIDAGAYTNDYRLSTHVTIGMMLVPYPPKYHKLVAQNGLTLQEIVRNLACVAENIIEPLIKENILLIGELGKVWGINSGFRMGEGKSQHNKGQAVDFGYVRGTPNRKQRTYELIKKVEKVIAYDQLILEFNGDSCWIHASYNPTGNQRRSAFTMDAGSNKVVGQGFILLSD